MRRVYKFTNIAVILAMILQILSGTIILAQDTTEEGFSEQTTEPTQIVLPEVEPTDSEGFNPETLLPAPLETEIPASATEEAEPINTETPVPEPTVEPTPIPSIEPTEVPRDPAEYEGIEATELSKTEFWETHFDIHKNSDFAELYFALQLRDTGLKFENDIYTYAYYVSVYKPTPDNLSYLQDLIIQGADVRLIFDLYVFWLDTSREITLINELYQLKPSDDIMKSVSNELWIDDIFCKYANLVTLTKEEVQNYQSRGLTVSDIKAANKLARKEIKTIHEILEMRLMGIPWTEIVKEARGFKTENVALETEHIDSSYQAVENGEAVVESYTIAEETGTSVASNLAQTVIDSDNTDVLAEYAEEQTDGLAEFLTEANICNFAEEPEIETEESYAFLSSTLSILAQNDYKNAVLEPYKTELMAPFVKGTEDYVDVMSGNVNMTTTNLVLPGKNGMDFNIGIRFNPTSRFLHEPETFKNSEKIASYLAAGNGWMLDMPYLKGEFSYEWAGWHDGDGYTDLASYVNGVIYDGTKTIAFNTEYWGDDEDDYCHVVWEATSDNKYTIQTEFHNSFNYNNEFEYNLLLTRNDGMEYYFRLFNMDYSKHNSQFYGETNKVFGYPMLIKDRFGNEIRFSYDFDSYVYTGTERLMSVTDSMGRTIQYNYNVSNNTQVLEVRIKSGGKLRIIEYISNEYTEEDIASGSEDCWELVIENYNDISAEQTKYIMDTSAYYQGKKLVRDGCRLIEAKYPTGLSLHYEYTPVETTPPLYTMRTYYLNGDSEERLLEKTYAWTDEYPYGTSQDVRYRTSVVTNVANGTKTEFHGDIYDQIINWSTYTASGDLKTHTEQNLNLLYQEGRIPDDLQYNYSSELLGKTQTIYNTTDNSSSTTLAVQYSYDDMGNVIYENDGLREIYYEYGDKESNPYGHLLESRYDDNGKTVKTIYSLTEDKKSISEISEKEGYVNQAKTLFTYDAAGNVSSRVDYENDHFIGEHTEYVYHYNDTDASYYVETKQIGSNKTLTSKNYYDVFGNLIKTVTPSGKETTMTYDAMGRLLTQTNPLEQTETMEYYIEANTLIVTNIRGMKVKYIYNPFGLLQSVSVYQDQLNDYEKITEFQYNSLMQKEIEWEYRNGISSQDQTQNFKTVYTYDEDGRVIKTQTYNYLNEEVFHRENIYEEVISFGERYNHANVSESAGTDYNKLTVRITGDATITPADIVTVYDNFGRTLKQSTAQRNSNTAYNYVLQEYDNLGRVLKTKNKTSVENGDSYVSSNEYSYNSVKTYDADGNYALSEIDWLGRVSYEQDYNGNGVYYIYDGLGRLSQKVFPAVFSAPDYDIELATIYTYDDDGNLIKESTTADYDPENGIIYNVIHYDYDDLGRIVEVKNAVKPENGEEYQYENGAITTYIYDDENLTTTTKITKNDGSAPLTTTVKYDKAGNVIETVDTLGNVETFEYNLAGMLLKATDKNGVVTQKEYGTNLWGNEVKDTVTQGNNTLIYTYQYDAVGNLKKIEGTGTSPVSYTYDFLGRLTKEENGSKINIYEYDLNGNPIKHKTKTGNAETNVNVSYSYNNLNRLSNMYVYKNDSLLSNTSYSYDPNGNITVKNVASNDNREVKTSYSYNAHNQITGTETTWKNCSSDGSVLEEDWVKTALVYDLGGRLESESTESKEYGGKVFEQQYNYDPMGRLLSDTFIQAGERGYTDTTTYQYDYLGNRIQDNFQRTGSNPVTEKAPYTISYTYDNAGRMISNVKTGEDAVSKTYTYDNNGNKLTESITKGEQSQTITNSYNIINQLTSTNDGIRPVEYIYSADGTRKEKIAGGISTKYVYNNKALYAEEYGTTAGQMFTLSENTEGIGIPVQTTGENAHVKLNVYVWNEEEGGYEGIVSKPPVASGEYDLPAGETEVQLALPTLPAGYYVWEISEGSEGIHLMLNPNETGGFYEGESITGGFEYWLIPSGQPEEDYSNNDLSETAKQNAAGDEIITVSVPIGSGNYDKIYLPDITLNDARSQQTFVGNAHGDVIVLLDEKNNPIANYVYDVFGNEREETFTYTGMFPRWIDDTNTLKFRGMYQDKETQNYYQGMVYYDTITARQIPTQSSMAFRSPYQAPEPPATEENRIEWLKNKIHQLRNIGDDQEGRVLQYQMELDSLLTPDSITLPPITIQAEEPVIAKAYDNSYRANASRFGIYLKGAPGDVDWLFWEIQELTDDKLGLTSDGKVFIEETRTAVREAGTNLIRILSQADALVTVEFWNTAMDRSDPVYDDNARATKDSTVKIYAPHATPGTPLCIIVGHELIHAMHTKAGTRKGDENYVFEHEITKKPIAMMKEEAFTIGLGEWDGVENLITEMR